ncbi:MAG: hemolysin family protein [Actinomycetota bacterium]|nr:hemolysin family protein [Actinomycetota bacterium]
MSTRDLTQIIGILVLLVGAGVFAAAEVAITRAGRARVLGMVEDELPHATILLRIVEQPARFLNVILLLLLVCHTTATTLAADIALRHELPLGELISTVVMTTLIFVFAEVAPKTFSVQHTDRVALRLAPLISGVGRFPPLYAVAKGLIGVSNVILPGKGLKQGPFVTEDDLRQMAEVAAEESAILEEEKEMIHSIFEFGDTLVREVMVPRPDMVAIEVSSKPRDVLSKMLKQGYSRMPVYEDTIDNIAGLVYAKDIMRRLHDGKTSTPLRKMLRDAFFVPDSKRISELFREMQTRKTHMAIVIDEFGDVAGLVTIEDLLEEIVGEIADEYDREEPLVEPLGETTMRVSGKLSIDELSDLLDTELPDTDWDTVGGLMAGLLGKVPGVGDEVTFQGLRFRAEKVQGRRIAKVLVEAPPADGQAAQ